MDNPAGPKTPGSGNTERIIKIIVPVEIDGREFAEITAEYTEEALRKRKEREERKKGEVA